MMATPTVNVAGRYRHPQTGDEVIVSESNKSPGHFIAGRNGRKYERGLIYQITPADLIEAAPVALDGDTELLAEVKALRAEIAALRQMLTFNHDTI
jgi:hypothetical protein